ncbi:Aste57867_3256 [Aphanomyces stellatus]|uniref:Aste57867_3256 protein n=1 Tax=Aphanomyces stellatus TaxID=120398 RepID=A0A485KAC3_9STRA|nr:hypothetical protein As57867_003246 [Aphanomyces stellatus]VFT80428.1 Aste57867_3256 [Aphanomyces stellatus]
MAELTTWSAAATGGGLLLASLLLRYLWTPHPLSKQLRGPKASSILLGNLLDTFGSVVAWKTAGNYPEPFLSWVKTYGGAVHYRELTAHVVLVTDPKALQYIFATNGANYPRDPTMNSLFADMLFGVGLLSADGAQHDQYRKLLNPLFTTTSVKSFVEIFASHAQTFCDTVLATAGPTSLNLLAEFHKMTLGTIGLSAFGFDFDACPEAVAAYDQCNVELSTAMFIGMYMIPGFLFWPLPELRRRLAGQRALKKIMMDVIAHKSTLGPRSVCENTPPDLLDLILPHATTQEALIHTMTFISAGHETTSSALCWIFAALIAHPTSVTRIRDEVQSIVTTHGSIANGVADLKYTLAVIQESMRLDATVDTLVYRVATLDDSIPMSDGSTVLIPAGTSINICPAAMSRNPKYWAHVNEFDPNRFLEGTPAFEADLALRHGKPHAFFYLPFSAGSKNCIGQRFALTQMQVVVATLVSQFDFELASDADLRHKHNGVTVHPARLQVVVRQHLGPHVVTTDIGTAFIG